MSALADEKLGQAQLQRAVSVFRQAAVQRGDGILGIEGFLVTYGEVNENGWLWVPGAAQDSVKERPSAARPLPMGYQHSYMEPLTVIGKWTEAKETAEGVHGVGRISDTTAGRDAATLVEDEAINGISVGFYPEIYQFVEPGERISFETPYGTFAYTLDQYAMAVIKADITEASVVHEPADDAARIDRVMQATFAKAQRALPALKDGGDWNQVAYSMARFMGGRGEPAFTDVPEIQHRAMYARLAAGYVTHGKTPPPYDPNPNYREVKFQHDERAIFHDRYLRKSLASVIAGVAGIEGALSPDTREQAAAAGLALTELLARRSDQEVRDEIAASLRSTLETTKENPK